MTGYQSKKAAAQDKLAQPEQEPVLQDIEQYRLQMAAISTAAIGYWKEGDDIHPDYDTLALRDVAKLYAKYDELYRAQPAQRTEQNFCHRCGKRTNDIHTCTPPPQENT